MTQTSAGPLPAPPVAPRRPVTRTWHGVERTDDYDWLRDKDVARGAGPPGGRERVDRAADRPPGSAPGADLRGDQVAHPGDRPLGAHPQAGMVVLRTLLRGPGVRRDLPGAGPGRGRLDASAAGRPGQPRPACAPGRAGPAGPGRAGGGPRVLLPGRLRAQPGRPPARLGGRHRGRRALHRPGQGGRGRPPARRRRRRRPRRGDLGPGRHRLLLHHRRRGVALRQGVAPPPGHGAGRGRAGLPRAGRPVLGRRRPQPRRPVPVRGQRLQDDHRVAGQGRPQPRERLRRLVPAPRGAGVQPRAARSSAGARSSWCCTTGRARTSSWRWPPRRPPTPPTGSRWCRTTPRSGWRTSTRSPDTWWCTSAARG